MEARQTCIDGKLIIQIMVNPKYAGEARTALEVYTWEIKYSNND